MLLMKKNWLWIKKVDKEDGFYRLLLLC